MSNNDKELWTFHQTINAENLVSGHSRQDILYRRISRYIKKGKLLEIGFGDGYLLKRLSEYYQCIGADISERNVEQMKETLPEVEFNVITVDGRLPYDDNYFDGFVASEVLEHMSNEELSLYVGEIRRVLKIGGYIFITFPANENLKDNECFCPKCGEKFHKWGHKQSWTKEKIYKTFSMFDIVCDEKIVFFNPGLNIFGKIGVVVKRIVSNFTEVSGLTFLLIAKKK